MSTNIHSTAIVDSRAILDEDVSIGPYVVIGPNVQLGCSVRVLSHTVIAGYTEIGKETIVYSHSSIGSIPQDLKYKPCKSYVRIGENTTIRESVTINPGTFEGEKTDIGNHCLLMAYSHVAHNCVLRDHVILANSATLAGHVFLDSHVIVGGLSAIHQFVRVGNHVMVGGMTAVVQDVLPYGLVAGNPAQMKNVNIVGLKRHGFTEEEILMIKHSHKLIFRSRLSLNDAVNQMKSESGEEAVVQEIISFLENSSSQASQRGLTR